MDNRDFKDKNKDRLCYCCDTLQQTADLLYKFKIYNRGYGSYFDGSNFTIQLCDKCKNYIDPIWFNEEPTVDNKYFENYRYEDEINKFIGTWIIENQEYILNELDIGFMERQDWIDYKKGILSDEKIEEYGYYSPRQIKAYYERFPTCNYPINVILSQFQSCCHCEHGSGGSYGQIANIDDCSKECYLCKYYIKRSEPIREMDEAQFERYIKYTDAKRDYLKYKDEFEK